MKTFLRSVLAVMFVAALTPAGHTQSCAKLSALFQDFESGFGSWQRSVQNCNSGSYGICGYTWSSGGNTWQDYGWGTCNWCTVQGGAFGSSTWSAVSDFSCGGNGGHVENVLVSPAVNFASICDPSLPPPTMSFSYAYLPNALQDNFGALQLSIEVTPDITSGTPSWFVVANYTDLTPLATGPAWSDLGSNIPSTYPGGCGTGIAAQRLHVPSASQWKRLTLSLPAVVAKSTNAAVRFRLYDDGGPSGTEWFPFYLDDISVDGPYNNDYATSAIGSFPNNVKDSAVVAPTTTFPTTMKVRMVGNGTISANQGKVYYSIFPVNVPSAVLYSDSINLASPPTAQCTETNTLSFKAMSPVVTQAPGEYTCQAVVGIPNKWDCNPANDTMRANLVVGFDYDVKPLQMVLPSNVRQEDIVSLPQTPKVNIRNIGLNDVSGFRVTCEIFDPTNALVFSDAYVVTSTVVSGTITQATFKQFTPAINGIFKFRIITQLGSDLNRRNDTLIEYRQFYWKYDVRADSIIVGLNALSFQPEVPQGGSYRPVARFDNNGASFVANIPITFEAWKLPILPAATPEFTAKDTMPELNIQDGMRRIAFNSAPGYNKIWTPQQVGDYLLIMYSDLPQDGDRTNDTIKLQVSSIPRLLGTYQVGFGQNIPTMQAALDSLKYRGVRGNVTFQLMDNAFNFSTDLQFQAVRYSGPTARVTFAPGPGLSPVINLSGGARLVMDFGTSYVGFDGNNSTTSTPNRNLTIIQGNAGSPAFVLARGAQYDAIKNCVIKTLGVVGQTTAKMSQTSVGIWLKNTYPIFPNDTLACNGNVFQNNDIQGFRTGIWLHGLAPVFVAGAGKYSYRWDTNNVVANNVISNVGRAGILATNQYGPRVYGNDVSNIVNYSTNSCGGKMDEDANVIGIGLGGVRTKCDNPFDNLGTQATVLDSAKGYVVEAQVYNNKIHDINSANSSVNVPTRAVGIEVLQDTLWGNIKGAPSTFQTPGLQPTLTHNVLWNNMIWNLNVGTVNGEAVGILFDARGLSDPTIPTPNTYFTLRDSVVNNTVWVTGSTLSRAVNLDLGHAQKAFIWNNIFVNDATAGTRSILTLNVQSPNVNLNADRNCYWFGSASANNAVSRLQILDANGNYRATRTYSTLEQWQAGSSNDLHSIYADPQFRSVTAPVDLHIKTFADGVWSPVHQQGGLLLNSTIKLDIDGDTRGVGGVGFDMGADEFAGKQYANDLYAMRIVSPISTGGSLMTVNPVNVEVTVQNTGTSTQLQKRIYLTVTPVGGGTVFYDTLRQDFKLNETKNLVFKGFTALPGKTYNIVVNVDPDNNPVNDVASTTLTTFVQQNAILVSYNSAAPNGPADRDSVIRALKYWGFKYDVLDRSTVTRAEDISYAPWPTVIYCVEGGTATKPASVGGGTYSYALSYDERQQLIQFLNLGAPIPGRRSLILAGMDVASYHDVVGNDVSVRDTILTRNYLHTRYVGTPTVTAYQGRLTGVRIEPGVKETINATGADQIDALKPIAVRNGTSEYAYYYNTRTNLAGGLDTAAGVTFWGQPGVVNYNTVFYGFDWRHLSRLNDSAGGIRRVILNSLDFIQKNGGCIVPCFVPVELASFDAKLVSRVVSVTWETASELNVTEFHVERRSGDGEWATIANGTVAARGSNSTGARYAVADPSITAGTYDYRLAYVHNDGHVEFSDVREVVVPGAYALYQNYPNPFNPTTQISYSTLDQGHVKLSLFDAVGNLVRVMVDESQDAGTHAFTLDASSLTSGVYFYRLEVNGFTQTRRLMLMK